MHPSPTATSVRTVEAPRRRDLASAIATTVERMIVWVGSTTSLALHTAGFVAFFAVPLLKLASWDTTLTVLTNVVSLEAIYLAIFIQFSVNRQAASLKEVEQDVESIQVNVEELGEHVEDIREDVEEIQEDIEEISEDESEEAAEETRKRKQAETLDQLTNDVKTLLQHLESLKGP